MNIRNITAILAAMCCAALVSCGDIDESSKAKRPALDGSSSSEVQSSAVDRGVESSSADGVSEESSEESDEEVTQDESSEAVTTAEIDYTKHEQVIDEHHSQLTQEVLDDKAVEVSFNWCTYASRGDIKSMQELCTPEFAAVQQELYDEYLAPCSDISINGYNYHMGDTPMAGINLMDYYDKIAWLRLEPQSDGSYLICDLFENRGREEPLSVMKQ